MSPKDWGNISVVAGVPLFKPYRVVSIKRYFADNRQMYYKGPNGMRIIVIEAPGYRSVFIVNLN